MRCSVRFTAIIGGSAAVVALAGCAILPGMSGPTTSETREIGDVHAIELDSSGDLVVSIGDSPSLTVTAGERIIDDLTSETVGDVLRLGTDGSELLAPGDIRYELTVTSLHSISLAGSGDAEVDLTDGDEAGGDADAYGDLTISLTGSGDLDVVGPEGARLTVTSDGTGHVEIADAEVTEVSATVKGAGDVVVAGRAQRQIVDVSGSGEYAAEALETVEPIVQVSASGGAVIHASGAVDARIDGSGDIHVSGDAAVSEDVRGLGELVRD